MRQILRILAEGAAQAWGQLVANKMRSFLSLLGVTIGIFCIIGVKSAVNSLEANIRGSLNKLGDDVVYVEKFSWTEDPGNNFWKWMRRPNFTFHEFEALDARLVSASKVGFWQFLGAKTLKWQSSSVENSYFIGCSEDCRDLFQLEFAGGRFMTPIEYQSGSDVCILGSKIKDGLFGPEIDPVGREIHCGGRKLRVIGALKTSGKDLLKPFNFDNCVLVGLNLARRGFNFRAQGGGHNASLMVKASAGISLEELKDEVTGVMRSERRLRPREEDNFSLNSLSILSGLFDKLFGVMNMAGFIIGIFALIVGMFSVANIMFVSVRERTNQIGIKMALGAKRWFILLEILVEAILLCIVGGALGLLFVWLATVGISKALDFNIFLSFSNILVGVLTSVIVGVLSGVIPAVQASGMDPVEAIRK